MFFVHTQKPLNFSFYANAIEAHEDLSNFVMETCVVQNKYTCELIFRTDMDYYIYLRTNIKNKHGFMHVYKNITCNKKTNNNLSDMLESLNLDDNNSSEINVTKKRELFNLNNIEEKAKSTQDSEVTNNINENQDTRFMKINITGDSEIIDNEHIVIDVKIMEMRIDFIRIMSVFLGSILLGYIMFEYENTNFAFSRIVDDVCNLYVCFYIYKSTANINIREPSCMINELGNDEIVNFSDYANLTEISSGNINQEENNPCDSLERISLGFIESALYLDVARNKVNYITKMRNEMISMLNRKEEPKTDNESEIEIETNKIETKEDAEVEGMIIRYGFYVDSKLKLIKRDLKINFELNNPILIVNFVFLIFVCMDHNNYDFVEVRNDLNILFMKKDDDYLLYMSHKVCKTDINYLNVIKDIRKNVKNMMEIFKGV